RPRPRAALLWAPADPSIAPAGAQAGRGLDPRPPGGRRELGRHPTTLGVLAHGAPCRRPRPRSSRAQEGPRRDARSVDDPPRRREPAGAGVPVSGLGYRARLARSAGVWGRRFPALAAERRAVAAARGDPGAGRLVRASPRS